MNSHWWLMQRREQMRGHCKEETSSIDCQMDTGGCRWTLEVDTGKMDTGHRLHQYSVVHGSLHQGVACRRAAGTIIITPADAAGQISFLPPGCACAEGQAMCIFYCIRILHSMICWVPLTNILFISNPVHGRTRSNFGETVANSIG